MDNYEWAKENVVDWKFGLTRPDRDELIDQFECKCGNKEEAHYHGTAFDFMGSSGTIGGPNPNTEISRRVNNMISRHREICPLNEL